MPTLVLVRHGQSALEPREPLHRVVGRRPVRDRGGRGPPGRAAPCRRGVAARRRATPRCSPGRSGPSTSSRRRPGRLWIPVQRHWRLNERHYGGLTGLDKAEDPRPLRRRAVPAVAPQLRRAASPDGGGFTSTTSRGTPATSPASSRAPSALPTSSCGWCRTGTTPSRRTCSTGKVVLVAAHGNSLRALIKHLDQMPSDEIVKLEIPTGVPIVYELDESLKPLQRGGRWLGDPEAIAAAAEAVRRQGQRP